MAGADDTGPFLGSIRDHAAAFRHVHAHWLGLKEPKPRRAVDPVALGAAVLPDLALMRVLPGPDFRYDLIGERFRDAVPRVRPGALAGGGEVDPGLRDGFIFSRLVAAATRKAALGACSTYVDSQGFPRMSVAGFLPLDLDGPQARNLLVVAWFDRRGAPAHDSPALAERQVPFDDIAGFLDRWAMG